METQRQRKIGGVIQKDIVDILQKAAIAGGLKGTLISVSKVAVTTDLSIAKGKRTYGGYKIQSAFNQTRA